MERPRNYCRSVPKVLQTYTSSAHPSAATMNPVVQTKYCGFAAELCCRGVARNMQFGAHVVVGGLAFQNMIQYDDRVIK